MKKSPPRKKFLFRVACQIVSDISKSWTKFKIVMWKRSLSSIETKNLFRPIRFLLHVVNSCGKTNLLLKKKKNQKSYAVTFASRLWSRDIISSRKKREESSVHAERTATRAFDSKVAFKKLLSWHRKISRYLRYQSYLSRCDKPTGYGVSVQPASSRVLEKTCSCVEPKIRSRRIEADLSDSRNRWHN